jgi:hypothetical protein
MLLPARTHSLSQINSLVDQQNTAQSVHTQRTIKMQMRLFREFRITLNSERRLLL